MTPTVFRRFALLVFLLATSFLPDFALADVPAGFAQSDGVKIAYYVDGKGPPLLLINGGPGFPAHHFGPLAKQLAARLHMRVIRFDQRGTGRSRLARIDAHTLGLGFMVRDVEALRGHLGITRWAVLGHSFGGINAMAYAIRDQARISRLILSAPGGSDLAFLPRLSMNIQARLTDSERREYARLSAIPSPTNQQTLDTLSITLDAYLVDKAALPALRHAVIDSHVYVPVVNRVMWQSLSDTHYDLAPELRTLHVSTLVLQGDEDPLGLDTARMTRSLIPGAEMVVVPHASHYMWIDNPEDYFSAIGRFLAAGRTVSP